MLQRVPANMPMGRIAAALFTLAAMAMPAAAQVIDHLGVPGPIEFDGRSYELAWSAKPAENYTKQEYLPSGQTVETYAQMLLVEVVTGNKRVMDAVGDQVDTLNKRKSSDPLVNVAVIENKAAREALVDFIVSAKDANGEYILEWNAYRYAPYRGASGETGVLLYAVSHRAYGNENAKTFLSGLKALRPTQIDALAKATLPISGN